MLRELLKRYIPASIKKYLRRFIKTRPSKARRESNLWLVSHASDINGHVLSIGSGTDGDREGRKYREYFKNCSSYTTSEVSADFECDMVLDVRSMPEIDDESFDCVFCSGVLEHVDDYASALKQITRILKRGGILLLGLPFRQAIHGRPNDYWRFTEYGIRFMLRNEYEILDLGWMNNTVINFPSAYWVKAKKKRS